MIPEAQKQQMAEAVAKIRETMAAAAKAAGRDPAHRSRPHTAAGG